jgi:hypothetical protein
MRSSQRGHRTAAWFPLFALLLLLLPGTPARALDAQQLEPLLQVRPGATCLTAENLAPLVEQWLHSAIRSVPK